MVVLMTMDALGDNDSGMPWSSSTWKPGSTSSMSFT